MADAEEEEWRKKLSDEEYGVLRERGTEPRFSGEFVEVDEDGMFHCAACGQELFSTEHKFDSGRGWPCFFDVADNDHVEFREDSRHGMRRTEVICANCGSHLGHVFDDGPAPTGKRYCINSVALSFEPHHDERSE